MLVASLAATLHPLPYDPDKSHSTPWRATVIIKMPNAVTIGVSYYHKDNLLLTTGFTMNNHVMANVRYHL